MIFKLESFIDTLILIIEFYFDNYVNILWLVFESKYFVSDLIPNGPLLRPIEIKFVLYKTVTVIEKDKILFGRELDLLT